MHSEICPVCQGKGTIPAVDVGDPMDDHDRKPCHGCKGRGWVEVQDSPNCYPIIPLPQCPYVFSWPNPVSYESAPSWDQPNTWIGDYATAGDPSKVVYTAE